MSQVNEKNVEFLKREGIDIFADNLEKILEIAENRNDAAMVLKSLNDKNKEYLPILLKNPEAYEITNIRDLGKKLFSITKGSTNLQAC